MTSSTIQLQKKINISVLDSKDKDQILKIANWYYDEWGTPIGKTIDRLSNQPSADVLFQLILTVGKEVIATGCVCFDVNILNINEHLNKFKPWVGLLYTNNQYRNKGYGKLLLDELEQKAKEYHFSKIYLYTFTAESLYIKNGWKQIDQVNYKDHETVIMEKKLNSIII